MKFDDARVILYAFGLQNDRGLYQALKIDLSMVFPLTQHDLFDRVGCFTCKTFHVQWLGRLLGIIGQDLNVSKFTSGDHTPLHFIPTCNKSLLSYIICHR